MKSQLRKCPKCERYTLLDECASCGISTVCPIPPRFSPDDRYGKYRRETIRSSRQ